MARYSLPLPVALATAQPTRTPSLVVASADDPSGLGYFTPQPPGPCAAPRRLGPLDLHFGYYTPE